MEKVLVCSLSSDCYLFVRAPPSIKFAKVHLSPTIVIRFRHRNLQLILREATAKRNTKLPNLISPPRLHPFRQKALCTYVQIVDSIQCSLFDGFRLQPFDDFLRPP